MTGPIIATLALVPAVAEACAVCLDSAYGDRSFNWAFVLFMLAPFVVAAALVGVLVWLHGTRSESSDGTEGSPVERPATR
jgi:hypothetical protein